MKLKITLLSLLIAFYWFPSTAQFQNALSFDGIDDYVSVPAASAMIAHSQQISLTCWVYPTNSNPVFPDYDGFAGFRDDTTADFYLIQTGPSQLEARFRNSAGIMHTIDYSGLQLNTWQHYAFTYDGTKIKLYKDGFIVDSLAASGSIVDTTAELLVGNLRYAGNNFFLNGMLDDVSLWSNTLLAPDIFCIFRSEIDTLTAGLEIYFRFNEGIPGGNNTSITVLDDVMNHADGTLNNFAMTGTISNFTAGVTHYTFITDSICAGATYMLGTQALTSAGVYLETVPAAFGCDSTIQLTLSVYNLDTTVIQSGTTLTSALAAIAYQWIDCSNGTPIAGATSASYTPSVNGSYAVILATTTCVDTSGCHQVTGVGLEENLTTEFNVYPSVTNDQIRMLSEPGIRNASLVISDVTGKEFLRNSYSLLTNEVIDVSLLQKGIYFLTVRANQQSAARRFIKN